MTEHAKYGFSSAKLWMSCGVQVRTSQGIPDKETEDSIFGDKSHKILEDLLNGKMLEEEARKTEEGNVALPAYNYVMDKLKQDPGLTVLAEYRTDITSTGRDDLWGTGDVFLYKHGFLEYIDLKTGPGTLIEPDDPQMRLNALGFLESMELAVGYPDAVTLTVIQPRYWDEGIEPIRSVEMEVSALQDWLRYSVGAMIAANESPYSEGTAGEHCKKCPGKMTCKYWDFGVALETTGVPGNSMAEVEPDHIYDWMDRVIYDNDQLSELLDLIPVIKDFCNAIEEHTLEIIKSGEPVPGYKVVQTAGREKWADEEAVEQVLHKTRIAKSAYKNTLKTPKQVMSLKPSKKLADKLQGLIVKTSGSLQVVRESDPRPSIAPDFKPVSAEQVEAITNEKGSIPLPEFFQ